MANDDALRFGPFELLVSRRRLLKAGEAVRLGSRALDLLLALTARPGEIMSNESLLATVWPDTAVEENNLRVHVTALRKALGGFADASCEYVRNVPGRGYCFVATVTRSGDEAIPLGRRAGNLPVLLAVTVGREEVINALALELERRRLVSIVGPGGIGKSTVALEVATRAQPHFPDGVIHLDLAPVNDHRFIPGLLAAALGQHVRGEGPQATLDLAAILDARELLIVIDGCEHMIEDVARFAETLESRTRNAKILATSREPLRAQGEWVHRLGPLDLPPDRTELVSDALRFASIQLFVQVAAHHLGGFELTKANVSPAAEICRRLDGIPLAIELAVARLDTLGVSELATAVTDFFSILTLGRRTALPRHQTLRATFDWSHQLLSAHEQALLRALGVFAGYFSAAAVSEVAGIGVTDGLSSLVAKSLVSADGTGDLRYRLLDTTRAYAREKLEEAGDADTVAQRHAQYYRARFERAEAEWEQRPSAEWVADHGRHLDNVRAALGWCFSTQGDRELGVALTACVLPLWYERSHVDECQEWVERALTVVETDPSRFRKQQLPLLMALGFPSMWAPSRRAGGPEAWAASLAIAEEHGDTDYRLRALWALWLLWMNAGNPRAALEFADKFCRLEDDVELLEHRVGRRLRARVLLLLGRPAEALAEVTAVLDHYVAPTQRSHVARFQYDQPSAARMSVGRALWALGQPERAMEEMKRNVDGAQVLGHIATLVLTLAEGACPVALLSGDLDAAERFIVMLEEHTRAQAFDVWQECGECYRGELLIRRGETHAGIAILRRGMAGLDEMGYRLYRISCCCALAQGLSDSGQLPAARAVIEEALGECNRTGEIWMEPELLRLRGRLALSLGDLSAAEADYRDSMRRADAQGARSWHIRTAQDLAALLRSQGRDRDAGAINL